MCQAMTNHCFFILERVAAARYAEEWSFCPEALLAVLGEGELANGGEGLLMVGGNTA